MNNQSLLQSLEALAADFHQRSDMCASDDSDASITWDEAAVILDELIQGHYPRDECIHCHLPIHLDSHGVWVDGSAWSSVHDEDDDICYSDNRGPHVPATPYTGDLTVADDPEYQPATAGVNGVDPSLPLALGTQV